MLVSPARTAEVRMKPIAKPSLAIQPIIKVKKSAPAVFRRPQTPIQIRTMFPVATVTKPKPSLKKPTVKKLSTFPGSTSKYAASADFSPVGPVASVFPSSQLTLGQTATFRSSASQHFQVGTLLSQPTEVRFTPVAIDWLFDPLEPDRAVSFSGESVSHAFTSEGLHEVQLRATYTVSYRVRGGLSWISEPDSISLSDTIEVFVSDGSEAPPAAEATKPPRQKVRLVAQNCLERPGSFGCD
jgi:hypothetical protein